ncbi:MAG: hypothetical protein ACKV0T_04085 [Planctomycetales bacterium]
MYHYPVASHIGISPFDWYNVGMDEQPKKCRGPITWLSGRSRRFWIVCGVLLPVVYVGSLGPACWLTAQPFSDETVITNANPALLIYWPIEKAMQCLPNQSQFRGLLIIWMSCGVPEGHVVIAKFSANGPAWIIGNNQAWKIPPKSDAPSDQ